MFVFVYAGLSIVLNTIAKTKTLIENVKARGDAIKHGKFAYWDSNGALKLTSTDEQIRYINLKNGDRTIQKLDGTIIKNITKETRDADICHTNMINKDNGFELKVIGRFCDVCPDKIGKNIWKYISKRATVYKDLEGNYYFKEPTNNTTLQPYVLIRVDDGMYTFLNTPNEIEQEWLEKKNYNLKNGTQSYIHLSPLVDRTI